MAGNSYAAASSQTKFSVVRYGNVIGSRGSIVELLLKNKSLPSVPITALEMTRFWIYYEQACRLVLFALGEMVGGEIFIPKVPSMKLVDLVQAIVPEARQEVVGIRPGEKMHETLVTEQEARHAVELDDYFVVLPEFSSWAEGQYDKYYARGRALGDGFSFDSHTNQHKLTIGELQAIIANLSL